MWINDAGEAMKLLEPPRATTLLGMKATFCWQQLNENINYK